jgi:hypothetical protein
MDAFLKRKPAHHPQAIWRVIEDETLILKLDTGQVSVLNPIGGQIWELMDGNRNMDEIVGYVGQTYAVPRQQAEQDVERFVQELLNREMLCWSQIEEG